MFFQNWHNNWNIQPTQNNTGREPILYQVCSVGFNISTLANFYISDIIILANELVIYIEPYSYSNVLLQPSSGANSWLWYRTGIQIYMLLKNGENEQTYQLKNRGPF